MCCGRSGWPGRRRASAYSPGSARRWIGMAQKPRVSRRMPGTTPTTPSLDQILEFCADDPVERVFLEDVARRGLGRFSGVTEDGRLTALCHVGANVVPSGRACDA